MTTLCVIDDVSQIIVNRVIVEDPAAWAPPAGHTAVEETGEPMLIGGSYVDGVYTPPVLPEPPPPPKPVPGPEDQILYDHENRLRAIEGLPPLSVGDFLTKMQ
jgi:hypothetical protein